MNPKGLFQVNSTNKNFIEKQQYLFKELDKVNVTLPQQQIPELEENIDLSEPSQHTPFKSLRGKESIFKKPETPLRKCLPRRRIPDFRKNPHKWTKYTLHDVKDEDMSERSNKTAALSFLKELENRKSNMESSIVNIRPNKITFQKTVLVKDCKIPDASHTFKSTKVLMPEYVVGQKIKKIKKTIRKTDGLISNQLNLSHLTAEEEEN